MAVKTKVRNVRVHLCGGKNVTIPAWEVTSGKPGPCLLLTAAQHGNEVQGAEAIRRFVAQAGADLACGKIFAVPMVNVPAVHDRRPHIRMKPEQPYGADRNHNMNRWWPGKANGNDTARIPAAIYKAFGEEATHAFDLHCWEEHAAPGLLIREAPGLREMAAQMGHRFVHVCAPSDITLAGHFCATGRIGATFEFSGQYRIDEAQVRHGLMLITNFAKLIGILHGRLANGQRPVLFSDEQEQIQVEAPLDGLFVEAGCQLCARIEQGEKLGHILCERDLSCLEITAPVSGYLRAYGASRKDCDVAMPGHHPYVTKGERLATIWTPKTP